MKEDVLPEGWEKTKLGKYLYLKNGYAFKKTDYVEKSKHSYPIIRISDINNFTATDKNAIHTNYIAKGFELEKNDLLIAMSGATTGKLGVYKGNVPAYQNQRVGNLKLIGKGDSQFRNYLMLSLQELIEKLAYGGAQPNISGKIIEDIDINLPPLPEQQYLSQKLTALLDEVAQTKQRLEAIPALLKQFRQSVLADAVSGRLTEAWRNTKGIKKNWKYEKAQNICDKVQSGSTPRGNPFGKNGTIPFLKVYNIVNQTINFDYKPQFITIEDHSKRSTALPNDILMNIVGPPLGKIAILTEQYSEWNINQAITLFRVNKEILNYKYLYFLLCEGSFIREIEHNLKGSVGQVNISLSQCRDMIIPTPPLEEQTQIVQKVETYFALADEIETQVNTALENVNLLTQSILAKAFSGELSAEWRKENSQLI